MFLLHSPDECQRPAAQNSGGEKKTQSLHFSWLSDGFDALLIYLSLSIIL